MPFIWLAEVVILCLKLMSDVFDPRVGGWLQKNLGVNDTGLGPTDADRFGRL